MFSVQIDVYFASNTVLTCENVLIRTSLIHSLYGIVTVCRTATFTLIEESGI